MPGPLRFLLRRTGLAVVTLLAIVTLSFFMQRLAPGGPFDRERAVSEEVRLLEEKEWRLDQPAIVQLGDYLGGMLSWPPDLKRSIRQPDYAVTELVAPRLAVSLSLAAVVMIWSLLVGVPLGVLAARNRNRSSDHVVMVVALLGISLPNFVIGPFFKWLFALKLGWFPESRWVGPESMVLPVLTLSLIYIATIARLVRSGMIETLGQDYVRTARAKGLSEGRVVWRHALPGALLPLVTWLGPALASLAVGSVVVERIFNIPGLGTYFVDAAFNRDYTLVMGTVIVYSALLIVFNILADLALAWLDPRIRTD